MYIAGKSSNGAILCFHRVEEHHNFLFYKVEEHVDDVVHQENRLCPIILGHIYSWRILQLRDFMSSQGAGTPQFVILLGGGTCG